MKNLRTLFLFILFFSSFISAGSKWTDATRFSTPLTSAPISDGFTIFALTQDGLIYSIKSTDGTSKILASLNSKTHVPIQKGKTAFFAGTDDGQLFAYSIRTAELLWSYPQKPKTYGQPTTTQIEQLQLSDIFYNEGVIYATFKTKLIAFSESTGAIIFERDLQDGVCVSADQFGVYVSDGDKVSSYSKDGRLRWSVVSGPLFKACPTPISSKLYVPTTRSSILALDSASGEVQWAYPINGWALSNPIGVGSSILVGTSDGYVLSLNAQTGALNYKTSLNGPIQSSPTILQKDQQSIVLFGTHKKSIIALNPQTGIILFDYQVSDWVDYITISDDAKTILAATRDNSLWAITAYPICTIDYPRTEDIIPQEITIIGKVFSFNPVDSFQILINSKPYPPQTLQGKTNFEYDVDLTNQPLSLVDIQCLATETAGLRETDKMDYKTQPILSLGARKLNMSLQIYPSTPQPQTPFTIYIRNSQGFDMQDVLLEYGGKNITVSSPFKTSAPDEGSHKLVARKSGYYPTELSFSTRQDMGLLPILGVVVVLLILIGVIVFFSKIMKKRNKK